MSKDPAFLFYPGDWDGGTKLFTRHIKGCYMDLLMCQFQNGHLTSQEIAFVLGQEDYDLYWDLKLKLKFVQDSDGKFYNQKLESEQLKRRKYVETRNNNRDGVNQYSGQMVGQTTGHTEGRMENEDININKDKKEYTKDFEKFYSAYPNKKDKIAAFKSWKKITIPLETILTAIKNQKKWRENPNGEFRPEWKNPATWLNKGSWDDELKTGGNNGTTKSFGTNTYRKGNNDRQLDPGTAEACDRIAAEYYENKAKANSADVKKAV